MNPSIQFHYQSDQRFFFQHRNNLKKFLLVLFKKEGLSVEMVNYIFCSDNFLLNINQEFLHDDRFTDIITFLLSDNAHPIISDIYISVDRIMHNSKSLAVSVKEELHRVIFHGALHLCGYNDKTDKEKVIMRKKEDFYLSKYFVSREIN
jgi:rRNA maturation RNase YbeY